MLAAEVLLGDDALTSTFNDFYHEIVAVIDESITHGHYDKWNGLNALSCSGGNLKNQNIHMYCGC